MFVIVRSIGLRGQEDYEWDAKRHESINKDHGAAAVIRVVALNHR